MVSKPKKHGEYKEIIYNRAHWDLLEELRKKTTRIMIALEDFHLHALVHGSIARGDINKNSDIDLFIFEPQSSFLVETTLEKAGVPANARLLIQATPNYAMKAYLEINDGISVSFPLMRMRRVEREFYKFSGEADLYQLKTSARVVGVDKRLMLIEPRVEGHTESSIFGREDAVAKQLNISVETVMDRVRTLSKRDEVGRTGVFIKKELDPNETFEQALKKLADENPIVRRRMKSKT